jgi:transcriptional regulator with XRE-family HTH domain
MNLQEALAGILRGERRGRGLTLNDLAAAAGLSVAYLGEIERGKKYPSVSVLERLAGALALEVPDLLELVADEMRGPQQREITQAVGFALGNQTTSTPRIRVRRLLQHLEPAEAATMAELGSFFLARRGGQMPTTDSKQESEP